MTETQRLLLAREAHRPRHGQAFHQAVQLVRLVPRAQKRFEFIGMVEMIFDDVLAAPGHEDELLDAGFHRFLDRVLHDGFVDDRQHFLRHGFGRRQEACSHARDGQNGFADWLGLGHCDQGNGEVGVQS